MKVQKNFLIDVFRCIGCDTCSIACKMENAVPVGENRLRILNPQQRTVFDKPVGDYPQLTMEWWPVMCQHCEDAPCIDDCPTYAIHQRADGMVEIDAELCIGCQNCGAACPYDAISFDAASGTADKCNMCDHGNGADPRPMCVETCPTRAIAFVDAAALPTAVQEWRPGRSVDLLNEDAGTRPTTRYLFRDARA